MVCEEMHGVVRQNNYFAPPTSSGEKDAREANKPMSMEEMQTELQVREALMQKVGMLQPETALTDQWRVYQEIISCLQQNRSPLRMFLQASAGTGKSFLIETVALWCLCNDVDVQICAPTGIAAARIRIPRTARLLIARFLW